LLGDRFSYESTELSKHKPGDPVGGEFIMVIDPSHGTLPGKPNNHLQRAEELFSQILAQEGTRLPSQRRYKARQQSLAQGISIAKSESS